MRGLKALTSKPVVGVGRFTSPDTMVRQIKSGLLDFIGAARPSIADPFLPRKIDEGRIEDICECIGCNICISGDMTGGISRCTQNPSFMEEWRKGWHPERMQPKKSEGRILIVGAGPAGLSAARGLGLRGYEVTLAEATTTLGGRVAKERLLPGLAQWGRVADYRVGQIRKMPNVSVYLDSKLTAEDIESFGFEHVAIATGSTWRRDGVARFHLAPIALDGATFFTPDDIMNGARPQGRMLIYDDDHYYMGGVLAELLATSGCDVTLVTPSVKVSEWTTNTLEQAAIQKRTLELGVTVRTTHALMRAGQGEAVVACTYTGREERLAADAIVLVTARLPNDGLYLALKDSTVFQSLKVIGDANAPAAIAWATYAGHRYAEEFDAPPLGDALPFRREVAALKG